MENRSPSAETGKKEEGRSTGARARHGTAKKGVGRSTGRHGAAKKEVDLSKKSLPVSRGEQLARDLWKATDEGQVSRVTALLEEGAVPDHPLFWSEEWKYKYPPLHQACRYTCNKPDIVTALVQNGADVKRVDRCQKKTPLHHACAYGNKKKIVQYLVEDIKCEVDIRDDEGQSPLDLALDHYDHHYVSVDVALYLINHGCDDDKDKAKLLCKACGLDRLDIVKELVEEHKHDPSDIRDHKGRSPLDLALDLCRSFDVALYLFNHGCDDDKDKAKLLCKASQQNRLDIVKEIVEDHGLNPKETTDSYGRSPLYWAISNGNREVERYLRDQGCIVVDGDKDGLLVWACTVGRLDVMKELIEDHDCDPTETYYGKTPLRKAIRNGKIILETAVETLLETALEKGHRDITHYLIMEKECVPTCYEGRRQDVLMLACEHGQLDLVEKLIEDHHWDITGRYLSGSDYYYNGETPLVIATRNGHTHVVDFLKSRLPPGVYFEKFPEFVKTVYSGDKVDLSIDLFCKEPVTFTCRWYWQYHPIARDDPDYDGSQTTTLIINEFQSKHGGYYTCIVTSDTDNTPVSCETWLTVYPGTPLTQDDVEALKKLLKERDGSLALEGINSEVLTTDSSGEVSTTLEKVQQSLRQRGLYDFAGNLKEMLKEAQSGPRSNRPTPPTVNEGGSPATNDIVSISPHHHQNPTTDGVKTLTVDLHLRHVKSAVFEARPQWKAIGRALGLTDGTIDSIHDQDDGECLHKVLSKWMHSGGATIHGLLDALEDITVARHDIAHKIRSLKDEDRTRVGL